MVHTSNGEVATANPRPHPPAPARAAARASKARGENCFDFLRLFAALTVVVAHGVFHLHARFFWLTPEQVNTQTGAWFFDGVELFFILSGYLIYRSCEKCSERGLPVGNFYLNRFLRVAPAIYCYTLLTPLLLLAVGAMSLPSLFSSPFLVWVTANGALVPVYFPDIYRHIGIGILNGSLWTIPVECSFYVVVPACYLLGRRFGFGRMITVVLMLALAGSSLQWYLRETAVRTLPAKLFTITFLPYFFYFGLGMFWSKAWPFVPQRWYLWLGSLALYASLRFDLLGARELLGPLWKPAWALPLSYAVLWFGYNAPAFFRHLTRVGDLSYGVYIWHMVAINLFLFLGVPRALGGRPDGEGAPVVFAVVAVTLAVALLSWWFVERPALRLKPFTSKPAELQPSLPTVGEMARISQPT